MSERTNLSLPSPGSPISSALPLAPGWADAPPVKPGGAPALPITGVLARGLSSAKIRALRAIVDGRGSHDVAAEAGVHRGTIFRWCKNDPAFRTALAACQDAISRSARHRILSVVEDAASLVRNAIRNGGDAHMAFALLKSLGTLDAPHVELPASDPVELPPEDDAAKEPDPAAAAADRAFDQGETVWSE